MKELERLECGSVQKAAYSINAHNFTDGDFDMHIGKSGRIWLVQSQSPVDGWIYASDPNPKSDGFGGGTMTWNVSKQNWAIVYLTNP